ncbi:Conidiation protein 6 domain containing protein [Naviculisporaceae sp. PSN 640]
MADPGNRERGLKAAINNPRVSEQAKQRDREILETEYGEGADPSYVPTSGSKSSHHDMSSSSSSSSSSKMSKSKSAGSAPSSSEYSTTSAFSAGRGMRTKAPPSSSGIMLPEESEDISGGTSGGKDPSNVIRGLKAAISNPNVSEKAKERDHQRLRELGGE